MVLLTITPLMLDGLQYLQDAGRIPGSQNESSEPSLTSPEAGNPISHGQVIELAQVLRSLKQTSPNESARQPPSHLLEHLLRGSRVYVEPPKPKAQPSSQYKALMARLRQEEEARAYDRMTSPLPPKKSFSRPFPGSQHAHLFPTSKDDIGDEDETSYADINRQMAVIANVVISIVACSVALWTAARHWSIPSRLGLSMGGSGMIGVAEVVVYAGYLRRVKEAKAKSKKEVEVKEIVNTWVTGGNNSNGDKDTVLLVGSGSADEETSLRKRTAMGRDGR